MGRTICKRSGRKHEHTWPNGKTDSGYLVVAEQPIEGTRSTRRWTAGFAADVTLLGHRKWVIRDYTTGGLLVSVADADRSRDETLISALFALETKIDRGDIAPPPPHTVLT